MEEQDAQGAVQPPADDTAAADSPDANNQTAQDEHQNDQQADGQDEPGSDEQSEEDDRRERGKGFTPHQEKRFRKMREKIRSQSEQLRQTPQPAYQQPYQPAPQSVPGFQVDPNREYTTNELQGMAEQYAATTGRALAAMEVQQLRQELERKDMARDMETRYEKDLSYIETNYPELNEDSEQYDEKLAERVAKRYERELRYDPTTSLKDIVEDYMWDRQRRNASQDGQKAAEEQAASAALSPGQKSSGRGIRVTQEWLRNSYDPKNPEHRQLVDNYYKRAFNS